MEPMVTEWRKRLDRREISATELAQHYLQLIERRNPDVNAIVVMDPELTLKMARDADSRLARSESAPLLGIPFTAKDAVRVSGLPTYGGANSPRPTGNEARVVQRVRQAGGVLLGKTNMPELGSSYETNNVPFGRTNHPLDSSRTPGGSSGGEGAALGADISPIGIGTDGGGSIRVPSHYCGILGLRPTVGRIALSGIWPGGRSGPTLDVSCVGPMARSTEDLALMLQVMQGADHDDPFSHPVPLQGWRQAPIKGMRVGWYVDDGLAKAGSSSSDAIHRAASILEGLGAHVEEVQPPQVTDATELFFRSLASDGGHGVRGLVGDAPEDHTDQFLDLLNNPQHGESSTAADFFTTLGRVHALRSRVRRWLDDYDVVLAPVSPGAAPAHGKPPEGIPMAEYGRYEGFNFTHTYSMAGVPAGSVPAGTDGHLPIGVQVVAQAWREDLVLSALAAIESATGGFGIVDRPVS